MKLYCKLVFYSFIFHILVSMHACVSWNYVSLVFIYLANSFEERDSTPSWISLELGSFDVTLSCWDPIFYLVKIFRIFYFLWRIRLSNWGLWLINIAHHHLAIANFFSGNRSHCIEELIVGKVSCGILWGNLAC